MVQGCIIKRLHFTHIKIRIWSILRCSTSGIRTVSFIIILETSLNIASIRNHMMVRWKNFWMILSICMFLLQLRGKTWPSYKIVRYNVRFVLYWIIIFYKIICWNITTSNIDLFGDLPWGVITLGTHNISITMW